MICWKTGAVALKPRLEKGNSKDRAVYAECGPCQGRPARSLQLFQHGEPEGQGEGGRFAQCLSSDPGFKVLTSLKSFFPSLIKREAATRTPPPQPHPQAFHSIHGGNDLSHRTIPITPNQPKFCRHMSTKGSGDDGSAVRSTSCSTEDPSSIPSLHTEVHTICNPSPRGSTLSSDLYGHQAHTGGHVM